MGLILAMLCGCGQRQSVSAEKETDRIVIWTWDDTFNVKAAKLAAKEYKKTHKDNSRDKRERRNLSRYQKPDRIQDVSGTPRCDHDRRL